MEVHGGNIYAASRDAKLPPGSILDFSASINALGMSPKALRALEEARDSVHHYPDPDCDELKIALSAFLQVDQGTLCIGNGSTELIYLLPRALKLHRALILGPTFSEYAAAVRIAGGQASLFLAEPENGHRFSLPRAVQGVTPSCDGVFLCNPNNPTGHALAKTEVLELWRRCRDVGVPLIVDEAFVDYCESHSVVVEAATQPGLVVLRSFTKFFGMPGLRVGYLVAEPSMVERICALQPPWSVNALAQLAARASLEDSAYIARSRNLMAVERPRFAAMLAAVEGVDPQPSSANFLFVRLAPSLRSDALEAGARARGVLIRDCRSFEGLGLRWIRVAVRDLAENARLVQVLKGVLAEETTSVSRN